MAEGCVLELLVENAWVAETLKALGGGHILHLSYAHDRIEPVTLSELRAGTMGAGTMGEILAVGPPCRRIAIFELHQFNDLQGFVRLDLRLLSVAPFVRDGAQADGNKYLCRCRRVL